jgi:16S rRNA processing protein RimM
VTTDHLAVGAIAGPHGVRGQFKVKLFAETPAALEQYGALQIDDGRALKLTVKSVNSKGLVIVSAIGVNSREAAEALRGMLLSTSRASLPDPAEDELYHADLLGAAVFHEDGTNLGEVVALYNFGAGEIIEVKPASGASVMLPFAGESVLSVDIPNRRVVLAPPAGFLYDDTKDHDRADQNDG